MKGCQLLAGGQAVIDDDMRNPREYPPGVTVVGYRDDNFVYLLPEIALKAVNRAQPLNFGANASHAVQNGLSIRAIRVQRCEILQQIAVNKGVTPANAPQQD